MKIIILLFNILFIIGEVIIDQLSSDDISKIRNQYYNNLNTLIEKPKDELIDGGYLFKDVSFDINYLEKKKVVCVIDIGGSFFKVGIIEISKKGNNLVHKNIIAVKEMFPENCQNSELWFQWTSKKIVEIIIQWNIYNQIDTCSLIFSYPVKYQNDGSAFPTAFPKFWCFENSDSKKLEILKSLNKSIINYIRDNKKDLPSDFYEHIKIRTVLNDSIATYFASKYLETNTEIKTSESNKDLKNGNIGMVLGTGTNASFLIIKNGIRYIFNTEWASFIPKDIKLLKEEELQLRNLPKSHNYIDVLCGLRYKIELLNLVIQERNLNVKPVTQDEFVAFFKNENLQDVRKEIFLQLFARSRAILAALMSSLIRIINSQKILLVLNGSAYQNPNESLAFLRLIKNNLKECNLNNVDVKIFFKEESAFMGSAYYALWDLFK